MAKNGDMATVRGKVDLPPRFELPGVHLVRSGQHVLAVGVAPIGVLSTSVIVPVARLSESSKLAQRQSDGWSRVLPAGPQSETVELPALVLSSRGYWTYEADKIKVFNNAWVIDGAKRLNALAGLLEDDDYVPIVVYFGLEEEDELDLRAAVDADQTHSAPKESERFRIGTNTQRIVVDDAWIEVIIESDPFVIATSRGYSTGLLVRRDGRRLREHLLIRAQSLCEPLESVRMARGDLVGVRLRLRKESATPTAQYMVQVLEG